MMARRYILPTLLWLVMIYALANLVERFPPLERWWEFVTPGRLAELAWFAVLFAIATMVRAIRFGILVRTTASVGWPAILAAFPWLFLLGALTPFRLGEGLRAVWIRKYGGSSGATIGFMVGERALDLLMLLIMAMLGLIMAPVSGAVSVAVPAAILAVALAGLVAATLMGPRLAAMAEGVSILVRFGIPRMILAIGFLRRRHLAGPVALLTVAAWAVNALGFLIALYAMLGILSIGGAFLCIAAVNLVRVISPAPGNIGSYQAAMVAALLFYGVGAEDGLIVAVLVQVAMLTIMVAQGLVARLVSTVIDRDAEKALPGR